MNSPITPRPSRSGCCTPTDEILDDLAKTEYPAHFHPARAVSWLIEDLARTRRRLDKALHPDTSTHDHQPAKTPAASPPHRPQQARRPLTAAGLTNQLP
jgi:hypothetical protein